MSITLNLQRMGICLLMGLTGACSTTYKTENQAITQVDESSGYRRFDRNKALDVGDTRVLLAFTGGGHSGSCTVLRSDEGTSGYPR
jgi:hypothetical protein